MKKGSFLSLLFLLSISAFATCEDTKMLYSMQYEASTGRFDIVVTMSQFTPKETAGAIIPWMDRSSVTVNKKPVKLPEAIRTSILKYREAFARLKPPRNTNATVIKNLQKSTGVLRVFEASNSGYIFQGLASDCDGEQQTALKAGYISTLGLEGKDAWKLIHALALGTEKKTYDIPSDIHYEDVSGSEFNRAMKYQLTMDFSDATLAKPQVTAADFFDLKVTEVSREITKPKYTLADHLYRALVMSDHLDCVKSLKLGEKASVEAQKSVETQLKALEKRYQPQKPQTKPSVKKPAK